MTGLRGLLVVIAGPTGVGKGTVHGRVRDELDDGVLSVSLTTRPPRPGEREGIDYRFVDRATFEAAIAGGELLEWTEYAGNLYGTPLAPVDQAVAAGKVVILDFEQEGAFGVKATRPETLTIALLPPSLEELERRLRRRGTEDDAELERRLELVARQMPHWGRLDVVLVNDDLDTCVSEVLDAIEQARRAPGPRPG